MERYGSMPVPVRRSEIIPAQTVKPSQPGAGLPDRDNTGSGTGDAESEGNRNGGDNRHGIPNTSDLERKQYLAEHFTYIRDIIEKNLSYPPRAQRMGWAGTVVVSLSIRQDGRIRDIRIAKSSGYDILDDNVVETIRKVEPFPRPPVPVELKIPLSYQLD
jgi:protein TonB